MSDSNASIRVCHLVGDLGSGGRKSLLLDLTQATAADSLEHTVACFRSDDTARDDFERAGIAIKTFDAWARYDLRVLKRTFDVFRNGDFDVVHTHGPNAQIPGRVLARLARIPNVVSTHHTVRDAHGPTVIRLERLTRSLDSATVAVSDGVKRSFGDHLDEDQWYTIPNGIDIPAFNRKVRSANREAVEQQWTVNCDGPVFLNVGRYVDDKAQLDLIKAMEVVIEELLEAHLFIVGGRGTKYGELTNAVDERGLADAITVTGHVPSIHEYYAIADAFVLSSIREGLPIVLLEAMAAELPIIATDIPGVREVVEDGETGYVVPVNSPSALAERMIALETTERRTKLSAAGFERAVNEFDIERTAKSYVTLYRQVTGQDPSDDDVHSHMESEVVSEP